MVVHGSFVFAGIMDLVFYDYKPPGCNPKRIAIRGGSTGQQFCSGASVPYNVLFGVGVVEIETDFFSKVVCTILEDHREVAAAVCSFCRAL